MPGSVEQIHVAPARSELPGRVEAVDVTADGVVGDRYGNSRDLTLIEAEALEGLREDTGIELSAAEPCNHLQGLTYPGVLRGLVHRGGLRADIVSGGRIAVGDEILRVSSAGNG
jgi:hypothetical protein